MFTAREIQLFLKIGRRQLEDIAAALGVYSIYGRYSQEAARRIMERYYLLKGQRLTGLGLEPRGRE